MPNFAALAVKKQELVRKGLEGSVFIAPTSAAAITAATLFSATNVRTVTDGTTTSGSANLGSATATFVSTDVGALVTGTGIPVGTTIASITSSTVAVMSANATATGASVSVTVKPLASLKTLPAGYTDLGWTTEAGAAFSRSISESTVTSWGSTSPTRTDVTADTTTMQVVAQETKLSTVALYTGVDPAGLVPVKATGGSIEIQKPLLPNPRYYRVLALAVDQSSNGEIYLARFLPNGKVTGFGNQAFANGADAMGYDTTFTGYQDSVLGYTESWLYGGPGWDYLLSDMGFPASA
jgi:hypothetical protein